MSCVLVLRVHSSVCARAVGVPVKIQQRSNSWAPAVPRLGEATDDRKNGQQRTLQRIRHRRQLAPLYFFHREGFGRWIDVSG